MMSIGANNLIRQRFAYLFRHHQDKLMLDKFIAKEIGTSHGSESMNHFRALHKVEIYKLQQTNLKIYSSYTVLRHYIQVEIINQLI